MNEPLNSTMATVWGVITTLIAFLFDVPVPVVIAAFGGSIFAVGMSQQVSYRMGFLMVVAGTIAASLLTPLVIKYLGNEYPARGIAAITAFVLIFFRKVIIQRLKRIATGKEKFPGGLT